MTFSNGWYKGSIPFYEITEVSVAVSGNGVESWESDGLVCYRSGTKVTIVCDNMTAIGERAFFKFLALKKVSGLGAVTDIGAYAFSYTPNIASIDIVPGNLTSIGASAFRMSSVEDVLDLSAVSLSIVGDMATRHKRWGTDGLASIQGVSFPKKIYCDVPNPENQDNYPDVKFGTYNGEDVSVAEGGCSALTLYHIWNYIHAGTDKQYNNWLGWYNSTINADGNFATSNAMNSETELSMNTKLGWTDSGNINVSSEAQLQNIIDRLLIGYPTYITINSVNIPGFTHAIAIIGCDDKTHKLAVIDSHVVGTSGTVTWLAYEDIFVGDDNSDRIRIIDYNLPVLAPNGTWFTQGGTSANKANITEVVVKDTHTPPTDQTYSWDASATKDGSIMVYVEGTKLTLVGNGHGKISLNADSSNMFNGFGELVSITGGSYLDTSRATTLERMFQACFALETVNVETWNTSNVTTLKAMFQGATSVRGLDVSKWNVGNVTDMGFFLNMPGNYRNTNLTIFDVSKWDVSSVLDMQSMFVGCLSISKIDVSKWDTASVNTIGTMFSNCASVKELDVSGWHINSNVKTSNMFNGMIKLEKIILGENFSFNGYDVMLPTPNSSYIPGATGNWYDVHGNAIAPTDVPDKTFGIYYATPAIAEEDMNQMVMVNKKNLMRTAAAIRTKLGSGKAYTHAEFADALLESV